MSESKKIKIAIDTLGGDHGKSGFGSYILYFISNLPKIENIEIELFGTEEDVYDSADYDEMTALIDEIAEDMDSSSEALSSACRMRA